MPTFRQVFPLWDPDQFELPGEAVAGEAVMVAAYRGARLAAGPKGGECRCCGQHIQVYRRSIYKRMAKCLIWVVSEYEANGQEWVNLKDGPIFRGGDNTKLVYWRLMVAHPTEENLYKPTQVGVDFVARKQTIPRYAYVFDGRVQGFSEERVGINDCLEGDFDLSDIGIAPWSAHG